MAIDAPGVLSIGEPNSKPPPFHAVPSQYDLIVERI
jgi:hypothetical protein